MIAIEVLRPVEAVTEKAEEDGMTDAVMSAVWTVDEVETARAGVPLSETILERPTPELEEPRMLSGSVDDIELAAAVDALADRRFVDVIVTVMVPAVSAIAFGIAEQMLYTLISSRVSLSGQTDARH